MGGNFRFFLALLHMTVKSAMMQRNVLLVRAVFSTMTHFFYVPVWFVIFSLTPDIAGWTIQHMLYAYGLSVAAWGVVSVLAYGLRSIPEQVDHGEFDAYLTLPKPVLLSAAISSSRNTGLGEIVFGILLIVIDGVVYGVPLWPAPLFLILASVVFASGVLLFASISFWVRQFYGSAEEIYFNYNLMASRPAPIFTGVMQFIALTLIPIGLMTHIPVAFVFTHHISLLIWTVIGTLGYAALAIAFFHLGLRHYESGNRFGVRG